MEITLGAGLRQMANEKWEKTLPKYSGVDEEYIKKAQVLGGRGRIRIWRSNSPRWAVQIFHSGGRFDQRGKDTKEIAEQVAKVEVQRLLNEQALHIERVKKQEYELLHPTKTT